MNNVPSLLARGVYESLAPFVLPDKIYTCHAVRTFDDCYREGFDVYMELYANRGLDVDTFKSDFQAGAVLVTLVDDDSGYVVLPSTYITAMPSGDTVDYHHKLISFDLGALPETLDLSPLLDELSQLIQSVLGITPTVVDHKLPTTGYLTAEEHAIREAARQLLITRSDTLQSRVTALHNENAQLSERYQRLEQFVIDNSLLDGG